MTKFRQNPTETKAQTNEVHFCILLIIILALDSMRLSIILIFEYRNNSLRFLKFQNSLNITSLLIHIVIVLHFAADLTCFLRHDDDDDDYCLVFVILDE